MWIVEGSAFVAAPLGGMTLAQLGADVIGQPHRRRARRQTLAGDRQGTEPVLGGSEQGKAFIAIDIRSPRGRDLVAALVAAPGPDAGFLLTNLPAKGWLSYDALRAQRPDVVMVTIVGNPDGSSAVDYTINPATGFPWATGPMNTSLPVNRSAPRMGRDHRHTRSGHSARRGPVAVPDRPRPAGPDRFVRCRLRHGRPPRQNRRSADQRDGAAQVWQLPVWRIRTGLSHPRRSPDHDCRADTETVAGAVRGDRASGGVCGSGAPARRRPRQRRRPVHRPRANRGATQAMGSAAHSGGSKGVL